ncbi:hypothetical protein [Gorillibacterium timonense]|nr:hypothetical protein [Gorillibacterium timonense]
MTVHETIKQREREDETKIISEAKEYGFREMDTKPIGIHFGEGS